MEISGDQPRMKRTRSVGAHAGKYKRGSVVRRTIARGPKVHEFTRKIIQSLPVTNALSMQSWALNWHLSDLPSSTEFTALFDMYRIKKIEITFIYDHNSGDVATSAGVAANANMGMPNLFLVTDHDDDTVLGGSSDYMQYEPCSISRLDQIKRWTVYPRVAMAAYQGAFTAYASQGQQWIDAASPGVAHYGCKFGVDASMCNVAASGAVRIGTLNVISKYFLECKDTR